jgi:hypothetical protein
MHLPTQWKRISVGCGALFASIASLALLSPVGAVHDELFHASSIWCAQGERAPYCTEITTNAEVGAYAVTNIDTRVCQSAPDRPLVCPTAQTGEMALLTNAGLYPGLFYRAMSYLVVPSADMSIVFIRLANAAVVCAAIAAALLVLPRRHRTGLLLTTLGVFNPFALYLFGSLNPSSWSIIGVLIGWLCFDALLLRDKVEKQPRSALVVLAAVGWLLAVGSRWDSVPYVALTVVVTVMHVLWRRFGRRVVAGVLAFVTAVTVGIAAIDWLTPFSTWGQVRGLFVYEPGQPDNTAFVSHYLLHAIPKALEALGEVPTMAGVFLPGVIFVANLGLLALLLVAARSRSSGVQMFGVFAGWLAIAVVLMAHHAGMDDRDPFGPSTRYVLPITAFAAAWWFTRASADFTHKVSAHVNAIRAVVVTSFALTVWTIGERFVDVQTFGLRYLPEGPDQWWWERAPVGPNAVVVFSVVLMAVAVWNLTEMLADRPTEVV